MTFIEDSLEKILKSMKIKYIREYPIGNLKVDFFLTEYKIVLEADGEIFHHNTFKKEQRDKALMKSGLVLKVLHFRGRHILKYQKDVRREIKKAIDEQRCHI